MVVPGNLTWLAIGEESILILLITMGPQDREFFKHYLFIYQYIYILPATALSTRKINNQREDKKYSEIFEEY